MEISVVLSDLSYLIVINVARNGKYFFTSANYIFLTL